MNKEFYNEPARLTPVSGEADVVVLGGGPAGIGAAIAAARQGASVILVEKNGYMGGVCTAGQVGIWHTLSSLDGKKIIGGVVDDMLLGMTRRNALYQLTDRGDVVLDTEVLKIVLDDLALSAGVRLLYHTYVTGVISESPGHIQAVIVENKSGRSAVKGRVFIDCTGDGDLAWHAGARFEKGNNDGQMQSPGLCMHIANLNNSKEDGPTIQEALDSEPMDYNGKPYPAYLWTVPDVTMRKTGIMLAAARITGTDCTDAESLSNAEVEGRRQIDWVLRTLTKQVPSFKNAGISSIAAEVGVRETRRFLGKYMLTAEDLLSGKSFPDTVARGTYPIDIHSPSGRGISFKCLDGTLIEHNENGNVTRGMWTKDGKKNPVQYYQIPYRVLLPSSMQNVMVAGRCISVTHEALGATRVMVNCMQLGQAAGVGAALASSQGICPADVDIKELQNGLVSLGMPSGW